MRIRSRGVVPYLDLCLVARKTFSLDQRVFIPMSKFVAGTFESSWAMWMFPS